MTLLAVSDLRVGFDTEDGRVAALDGVDLALERGETLALVGESGSGKSVLAQAILGLVPSPPGRVLSGRVAFDGTDLTALGERALRRLRGAELALVPQDPGSALNPLLPIGLQLSEVLEVHRGMPRREARRRSARALGEVGIPAPEARLAAYPHELSGGMRQRVLIAMALLCEPELLLADEPTTALDVTIQAQILEVLRDLRERCGTAILFITHDLGLVRGFADRVCVLYAGRVAETAPAGELFRAPLHPYSAGLLASVPSLAGDPARALASIPGQPPVPHARPPGCAFHPRCARAHDACLGAPPALEPRADGRAVACLAPLDRDAAEEVRP